MNAEEVVEIPLTRGKKAIVDIFDAHLAVYKWTASQVSNGSFYARRYFKIGIRKYGNMQMHHCIVGFPLNGFVVDHINGNTLDNRRANLRIVSVRENSSNKKINRDGKIPGVIKQKNRWRAVMWRNGKNYFIGLFPSYFQAVVAREKALAQWKKATEKCPSTAS